MYKRIKIDSGVRDGYPWVMKLCLKFLVGASGWFHVLPKTHLSPATAWPSSPVRPPLSLPPGLSRPPRRSALGPPGVPAPRALAFHKSVLPFSSWGSSSVSLPLFWEAFTPWDWVLRHLSGLTTVHLLGCSGLWPPKAAVSVRGVRRIRGQDKSEMSGP